MRLNLRIGGKYLNFNKHEVQAVNYYATKLYPWHIRNLTDDSWYFVNDEGKAERPTGGNMDSTLGGDLISEISFESEPLAYVDTFPVDHKETKEASKYDLTEKISESTDDKKILSLLKERLRNEIENSKHMGLKTTENLGYLDAIQDVLDLIKTLEKQN